MRSSPWKQARACVRRRRRRCEMDVLHSCKRHKTTGATKPKRHATGEKKQTTRARERCWNESNGAGGKEWSVDLRRNFAGKRRMRARASMQGNAIVSYAIATMRISPSSRCAFHEKSQAGISKTSCPCVHAKMCMQLGVVACQANMPNLLRIDPRETLLPRACMCGMHLQKAKKLFLPMELIRRWTCKC